MRTNYAQNTIINLKINTECVVPSLVLWLVESSNIYPSPAYERYSPKFNIE